MKKLCGSLLVAALFAAPAFAQMQDGNMDNLNVGTAPDVGTPAGAWLFPQNYVDGLAAELLPPQLTIAKTSDFDANTPGNSLHLKANDAANNFHLPNIFPTINDAQGLIVTLTFDMWVVAAPGGSMYIGGDHGGGGFANTTDRGPQMTWMANGNIVVNEKGFNNIILQTYPVGVWQSVKILINMNNDTCDIYWAKKGDPYQLLKAGAGFRATSDINHLDRFTFVHFGATTNPTDAYIDNIVVSVPEDCYADCDGSGELDVDDFICFQTLFGLGDLGADCDGSGELDIDDFICYQTAFGIGCG